MQQCGVSGHSVYGACAIVRGDLAVGVGYYCPGGVIDCAFRGSGGVGVRTGYRVGGGIAVGMWVYKERFL